MYKYDRSTMPSLNSLIGKVAADHGHKWIFKEPSDHEINFLSAWNNPVDSVSDKHVSATLTLSSHLVVF